MVITQSLIELHLILEHCSINQFNYGRLFCNRIDWLSFSAKSVTCRSDCEALVVNWGKFSGNDYACLVANIIKPLGNLLGKIFCKLGPSKIHIGKYSINKIL